MPDYTKMRASKRIRQCPKCGRKGKFQRIVIEQQGHGYVASYDSYYHVTELSFMGGESVRDHCSANYARKPLDIVNG